MGKRITPDNNDIVVWSFDDFNTNLFLNSSTSTNSLGSAANLTVTNGTFLVQQPSLFAKSGTNSCVRFTGNNSGTRNYISGANTVEPQAPVTFSGWFFVRTLNPTNLDQHLANKQNTAGVWSGSTFAVFTFHTRASSGNPGQMGLEFGNGGTQLSAANLWPQGKWCHLGLTYDGANMNVYMDGTLYGTTTTQTGTVDYGGHGPWFFGAIPSGSGNPEESSVSICDFRIANVVRPQSYFANIFNSGISPNSGGNGLITYYKLRVYDLSCATPTPVYWVSIFPTLAEVPSGPCGGNFSELEIVESWNGIG